MLISLIFLKYLKKLFSLQTFMFAIWQTVWKKFSVPLSLIVKFWFWQMSFKFLLTSLLYIGDTERISLNERLKLMIQKDYVFRTVQAYL